jgi:hypothetical protein
VALNPVADPVVTTTELLTGDEESEADNAFTLKVHAVE